MNKKIKNFTDKRVYLGEKLKNKNTYIKLKNIEISIKKEASTRGKKL